MTEYVTFGLQVILSVVAGGLWVATATLMAERVGEKAGGFISGFPSTTVVALLFIGWSQGDERLIDVASILPATFAAYGLFLFVYWRLTVNPTHARKSLGVAFVVWLVFQAALFATGIDNLLLAIAIWLPAVVVAVLVKVFLNEAPRRVERMPLFSTTQALWRIYIGGGVVGASVLISKLVGPFLGAVFASAPASTIAILYVIERVHGTEYARALVPTMMVSGLINVVMFASMVWLLTPYFGSIGAIFSALTATFAIASILYKHTTLYR